MENGVSFEVLGDNGRGNMVLNAHPPIHLDGLFLVKISVEAILDTWENVLAEEW